MLLGSGDGGMFPDKRPLCAVRLHRAVARPQRGPQPLAGARRNNPPRSTEGCRAANRAPNPPGWVHHGVPWVAEPRSQSSHPAALLNLNVSSASQGMGTAGQTPSRIQSSAQPDLRLLQPSGGGRWGCVPMGARWGCVPIGARWGCVPMGATHSWHAGTWWQPGHSTHSPPTAAHPPAHPWLHPNARPFPSQEPITAINVGTSSARGVMAVGCSHHQVPSRPPSPPDPHISTQWGHKSGEARSHED